MQHQMDAHRAAFQRIGRPQLLGQLQIVGGAEGVVRRIDHAAPGVVLAIVGDNHGHAQAGILAQRLHGVVVHDLLRRGAVGIIQVRGDIEHVDVIPHGLGGEGRVAAAALARAFIDDFARREHIAAVGKVHAPGIAAGVRMVE